MYQPTRPTEARLSSRSEEVDICLSFPPDRTWHKVNDPRVDYNGDLGEGKVEHEPSLDPCCSSAHLVQCGLDEPSWTWAQIWVQIHMPDFSLNWTAKSSAIQGWQRCLWCSSTTRRWPSWGRRPFGLKFAMELWLPETDARQSAEKLLHEAVASRASLLGGNLPESKLG